MMDTPRTVAATKILQSSKRSPETWQQLLDLLDEATSDEEREELRQINEGYLTDGGIEVTFDAEESLRKLEEVSAKF